MIQRSRHSSQLKGIEENEKDEGEKKIPAVNIKDIDFRFTYNRDFCH